MVQLLSATSARGMASEYIAKLLAEFESEQQKSEKHVDLGDIHSLIEPLSSRELEILQLITLGLSNHEISERLFLALSTVKGHNRVIFDKVQVHRRTEADARARELGRAPPSCWKTTAGCS